MSLSNISIDVRSQLTEAHKTIIIPTTSIVLMVEDAEMISPSPVADSVTGGAVIRAILGTANSTNSEILRQIRCWFNNLLLLCHVSTHQSL
jgi:hypothetical protein